MKRVRFGWICALALTAACTDPGGRAAAPTSAGRETLQAPTIAAVEPAAPTAELATDYAEHAFVRWMHGESLEAYDELARALATRVRRGKWSNPSSVVEALVAAETWRMLGESLECTVRTRDFLDSLEPLPAGTPSELASVLEHAHALALRATGKITEARALSRSLGTVTEWMLIGPFDNERGGGFDKVAAPEQQVALDLATKGKEREVRWRANPAPEHPLGRVLLDKLFKPNAQVAAYLATSVASDRERELVLQIGSSSAVKIFVNGHAVLSRKVRRPFHADQDAAVVTLGAGVNQILVKLALEEWPDWVFEARVTELDGRPATDLVFDARRAGPAALTWSEPKGRRAPTARELADSLTNDPRAARWRAELELELHPEDLAAKSAKHFAEKARDLEPANVWALYQVARATAPETGLKKEEREIDPHLAALRAVLDRDAQHVAALCDLADFYAGDDPIPTRQFEYASRAFGAAPKSPRANQVWARALEARGLDAEADRVRKAALELPAAKNSTQNVLARFEVSWNRGERESALALLEHAFDEHRGAGRVFERLCELEVDAGRLEPDARSAHGSLRSTAEALFAAAPFSVDERLRVASFFEHSQSIDAAAEILAQAQRLAPEDTRVLTAQSRIALRRGDTHAADAKLAEVLRIDPGDSKARRQRALLAVEAQDRFEAPYRRDAVEIVKAAPPPSGDNDPLAVLDRESVYRLHPDGSQSEYEHLVVRAQNLGGVKALDHYGIAYHSDSTLQVLEMRVIHADGSATNAPAPDGDRSGGDYDYRVYDLPPLEVGDSIDAEYRIDATQPGVFGQYFGLRYEFYPDTLDRLAPTARAELVVIAPKGVELYPVERHAEQLERERATNAQGELVMRWRAKDLKRPSLESAMPQRSEFAPGVDVTTYKSWDEFAKWWWHFIEKEFVTSPEMKAKVAELTAGLSSERDKVQAITRFVGQEIRYNAWEFGPHGYQPYSAATIFERRFGDCKDKSILLRQMLAEIGVVAHPVLIKAEFNRPNEPLEAAMVEHFDHCIAYVPATQDHEGYYLDATADRNPLDYLRVDDQGAHVLHVDEHGGSIHVIPYAPPPENTRRQEYRIELAGDGSAKLSLADTSNGFFGVATRYQFGGEQGDLAKRFADEVSDAFGKVEVKEVHTSKLEDIGAPARLDAVFLAKGLWARESRGATLRSEFAGLGLDSFALEAPQDRHYDVVLDRPFGDDTTIDYVLPKGARVIELPPPSEIHVDGILDYRIGYERNGDTVRVQRSFQLKERRIALERYADFQSGVREIRAAEQRTILVQPPPGAETTGRGGDK